jgi:AraC family transcriptional regulator
VLRDLGLQLHHLIERPGPVDSRCADELVTAVATHVASAYPAEAGPVTRIGAETVESILDALRDEAPSWEGVTALAARCGLSRSHFSRRVRAFTGVSPYAVVLGSRVEAAKHALERGGVPLGEVAYVTGFADQSHLTRVFRRVTGLTPARYRATRGAARDAARR